MKPVFIFYFFLSTCFFSKAQITNIVISQKMSLHTAVSDNNIDVSSILSNQAAGLSIDGMHYGILAEKKYLMNELNQMVFFVSKNYSKYALSIIQDYNGFSENYSMQSSLGLTKLISENTSLGVRFNYQIRHIKGTQNGKSISGEISLKHKLTKSLQTGLIIVNPQSYFNKKNDGNFKNESCFKWGLLYDVSKQFYVFIDLLKPDNIPFGVVGGCAYYFNNRVDAMYTFSINEMSNSLCIGINLNKMKIKMIGSYHPQLGYSPTMMLQSKLKEKSHNYK